MTADPVAGRAFCPCTPLRRTIHRHSRAVPSGKRFAGKRYVKHLVDSYASLVTRWVSVRKDAPHHALAADCKSTKSHSLRDKSFHEKAGRCQGTRSLSSFRESVPIQLSRLCRHHFIRHSLLSDCARCNRSSGHAIMALTCSSGLRLTASGSQDADLGSTERCSHLQNCLHPYWGRLDWPHALKIFDDAEIVINSLPRSASRRYRKSEARLI